MDEGRSKKDEGRSKKDEGRRMKEDVRRKIFVSLCLCVQFNKKVSLCSVKIKN